MFQYANPPIEDCLFGVPEILWNPFLRGISRLRNFLNPVVHLGVLIDAQRLFNYVRVRRESEERGRERGVLII
jgi:hypothetical protein